jgi:hypothetical protein
MADYAPVYANGTQPVTHTTSAAVTAGRVLAVSGNGTVAHAAAANSPTIVGVAAHDAGSGARVAVWPLANAVHELSAPGAITAGAGVATVGTAGEVQTAVVGTAAAGGYLIGIAATTAANGKVRVAGRQ